MAKWLSIGIGEVKFGDLKPYRCAIWRSIPNRQIKNLVKVSCYMVSTSCLVNGLDIVQIIIEPLSSLPFTYTMSCILSERPIFEIIENGLNCLLALLRSRDKENLKKYSDFYSLTSPTSSPVLQVFHFS